MTDKEFASTIKAIVNSRGIRYSKLAENAGIEYQRIIRIFNQGAIMTGTELLRLCYALDLDPNIVYKNAS